MWTRSLWLTRRIDPTIDLLPWGPEVGNHALQSLNIYRANVLPRLRNPLPWRTSVPVLLVVATQDAWITSVAVAGLEASCRDLTAWRSTRVTGFPGPGRRSSPTAAGFVGGHG